MKKIYYLVMAVVATLFVACSDTQTPETDTTKLYPAMDPSGEMWGYIDAKGNFAIQPMYDDVMNFSCGYARVWLNDEIKFIDNKGKIQPTMSYDYASDFYHKYSTIGLDDRMGLLGTNLSLSIQPFYYYLGTMGDNGLIAALMDDDSKFQYVNAKGDIKIPAMFDSADDFNSGVAIIALGGKYGVINSKGDFTIQPTYKQRLWNMGEGLVGYNDNDKMGFMDANGNLILPAMYTNMGVVSDGMIPFQSKTKCGYLDTKGNIVIPDMYLSVSEFYEGCAWVRQSENSAVACINKKNEVLFYLLKDEVPVRGFHNGLALIQTKTGYKYIDKKNNFIYAWSTKEGGIFNAPENMQNSMFNGFVKSLNESMTLHFDSRKL